MICDSKPQEHTILRTQNWFCKYLLNTINMEGIVLGATKITWKFFLYGVNIPMEKKLKQTEINVLGMLGLENGGGAI